MDQTETLVKVCSIMGGLINNELKEVNEAYDELMREGQARFKSYSDVPEEYQEKLRENVRKKNKINEKIVDCAGLIAAWQRGENILLTKLSMPWGDDGEA